MLYALCYICSSKLTVLSVDRSTDSPAVCGAGWDQVISGALDEHKIEVFYGNG